MIRIHHLQDPWHDPGFWTAMLFIEGSRGCVLLDSGVAESVDRTLAVFLAAHCIPWTSVKLVLNTHFHEDHAAGNALIRERSGAGFAIHSAGREELERSGFRPEKVFSDNDLFTLGEIRIRVIHTPGHSPDSCCFLEENTKTLFTGDSVQGRGSPNIGLPLFTDPAAYRASIERLRSMFLAGKIHRICCGHPELPFEGDVQGADAIEFLDVSIRALDECERAARDFLAANPAGDADMLRKYLLKHCGSTETPSWAGLSYGPAAVLLHFLRS